MLIVGEDVKCAADPNSRLGTELEAAVGSVNQ